MQTEVGHRRELILAALHRRGFITMREAADIGQTSEQTARRDLRLLAERGLVRRTHGGAALRPQRWRTSDYHDAATDAIAAVAASLVQDGATIVIGPGPPACALARHVAARKGMAVITNSTAVVDALNRAPTIQVLLSGGLLSQNDGALVGPIAEESLSGLAASIAFLSGDGLTPERGLSTRDYAAASVVRRLAALAPRIAVLARSHTLGMEATWQTVDPLTISWIVTDDRASEAMLKPFRDRGVSILVAAASSSPAR